MVSQGRAPHSKITENVRGTWVAQSVTRPTLDSGSGHDLTVYGIEPGIGIRADSAEPAWNSFSPSLSAPPLLTLSLKISIFFFNC